MKAFEIFKTGKHTSDKGITREYTTDDLDKIAANYNPDEHEAPIVIGHPKNNAPAYGWIEKLQRVGEKLIAIPKQVNQAFADMVKDGAFKKRSISITNDLKLNHVGFLGAAAPAVKGLKDVEFSADAEYSVFELDIEPVDESSASDNQNNHTSNNTSPSNINKSQLDNLQAQIDSLVKLSQNFAENSLSKDELDKIHNQINELRFSIQVNEFELMLNEKLAYGSITPAMKNKILSLINFIRKQNFSDESFSFDSYVNSIKEHLTEVVNSIPKIIYYEEFAKKGETEKADLEFSEFEVDRESLSVHKEALALSKKEEISYVDAITKLVHGE